MTSKGQPIPESQGLRRSRHRMYAWLLVLTIGLMGCRVLPFGWLWLSYVGNFLLTLALLVALGGTKERMRHQRYSLDHLYRLLGLGSLAAQLLWVLTPVDMKLSGVPLLLLFTLFIGWSLKRLVGCLALEPRVSQQVVMGTLAGYLLLGISGGLLLSVLATLDPPGFMGTQIGDSGMPGLSEALSQREVWRLDFTNIFYFAFVSLTTVGYGDILPVSASTKMASIALSVAGPLYIAVVMGLLISRLTQEGVKEQRADPEA